MPETFTWDPVLRRYRTSDGRLVSEAGVRQAVDAVVDGSAERLAGLTQRLTAGALDLATWQQQFAAELKAVHVATATAAHGGWAQMSPADWGWVGQRLRTQYGYLRDWAADLAAGTAPLDGRTVARATLYGDAARQTYQEMARRDARLHGGTEERRLLRARENCAGCRAQAALGWQPAGTLAPLGSQQCLSRCRCVWDTRVVQPEAA